MALRGSHRCPRIRGRRSSPKGSVVFLDPPNKLLELLIQRDRLSAKDQLVQVLSVSCLNS
jgi:hypothetical protein